METKVIQVGIVGCGRIAEHHLRFLSEHPRIQIVAVSDPDHDRAKSLADRYRVPQRFTELRQMLEQTHLDVLHVLTPPSLHYEQAAAAIEAGVHVLVEKPVALSSREVEDLFARARQKNVKLC